ncbi:MAG: hypothetical protein HY422_03640, partial [Candidatus Komeilibacteria bacterium]|nr:hypothetical protein [Candidatus Komeilibacteria bacterium]
LNGEPNHCSAQCTGITQPYCGNSVIEAGEQCDSNVGIGQHQQCNPTSCQLENLTYCGDDAVQSPNDEGTGGPLNDGNEECDGSAGVGENQACTSECTLITLEFCGDDEKNGEEECDGSDGVGDHQQCTESCTLENLSYCGDGFVQTPNDGQTGGPLNDGNEECDGSAGVGPHQSCSLSCELNDLTFCGDGVAQNPNEEGTGGPLNDGNEQCDGEAGVGANESCTQQCTLEGVSFCGDGNIDQGESCDDGSLNGQPNHCNAQCSDITSPVCGNDVIEAGEQCDDDNTTNGDGCSSSCTTESLQCTGSGTYTVNSEFDQGSLINVTHTPSDQLQLSDQVNAFNFIWVAVSTKGTVVKIDTDTGAIVGEYKTSPSSQGNGDPSRTTVDKDGSVWLSNRSDVFNGHGSIIHIGLVENGQCEDRNGNGIIETSTAQNTILDWDDASGTRNVATADDECIVHYVELPNSRGTRHVSVDANNDVWAAGLSTRNFDLVKGGKWNVANSGTIIRSEPSVGYGGYGGLIDPSGVIWSANRLLRWDTANPLTGANGTNWTGYEHDSYGLCIDSQGNVWNTSLFGGVTRKFAPDGSLLGTFPHGFGTAQGCAVDGNDHVWVAHSLLGGSSVGHLLNDGTFIGNVPVGSGPTGVSVDANGKVWATNYYSKTVSRIDPTAGALGADLVTPIGAVDFTSVDLGGNPYNYSDMTGSTLSGKAESGTWTVVHDGVNGAFPWKNIDWNASVPSGGSLTVTVATSADGSTFGAPQSVADGQDLTSLSSRYLKVVVSFERGDEDASPVLFDLAVNRNCGGDEPPTTTPPEPTPPSGGGGGGGGGGFQSLLVFNEKNETVALPDSTVSWFTNVSATCVALYDDASHDNTGTPPAYGYDSQVPGITGNGTYHTATLTGLTTGVTYYWRPNCTATGSSQTALGQQLTIALAENPVVLGFEAPAQPEENVKVLGFEILPKTGGDLAGYYAGIFSVFGTILIGLYLGYRRSLLR